MHLRTSEMINEQTFIPHCPLSLSLSETHHAILTKAEFIGLKSTVKTVNISSKNNLNI